jgi:SanA protein
MWKQLLRFILRTATLLIGLGMLAVGLSRLIALLNAQPRTFNVEDTPASRVAIVFGAGLRGDGSPTLVLRDRVETAVALYVAGKVDKLLMSGDNSTASYNEPKAMADYAVRLGVPASDIVLDYAGRRTYDTCYRARAIFGIDHAILVTQPFHLPRALYTCRALGIDAAGVESTRYAYRRSLLMFWNLRELPATLTALMDVHIFRPKPILGNPEPIFTENN